MAIESDFELLYAGQSEDDWNALAPTAHRGLAVERWQLRKYRSRCRFLQLATSLVSEATNRTVGWVRLTGRLGRKANRAGRQRLTVLNILFTHECCQSNAERYRSTGVCLGKRKRRVASACVYWSSHLSNCCFAQMLPGGYPSKVARFQRLSVQMFQGCWVLPGSGSGLKPKREKHGATQKRV